MYNKGSHIIGHEVILHEGNVWIALISNTLKQYKKANGDKFMLTSIELHIFDINNKGAPVKSLEIASTYG